MRMRRVVRPSAADQRHAGERDGVSHPVLALQRAAGNRAVAAMLGTTRSATRVLARTPQRITEIRRRQSQLSKADTASNRALNRVNEVASELIEASGITTDDGQPIPAVKGKGPPPATGRPPRRPSRRLAPISQTIGNLRRVQAQGGSRGAKATEMLDIITEIQGGQRARDDERRNLDRELTRINPNAQAGNLRPRRPPGGGGGAGNAPGGGGGGGQGGQVQSPSRTGGSTSRMSRADVARVLTSGKANLAKAVRFTKVVGGFMAAFGALTAALDVLAAIDNMNKLLAHGTALPKEQAAADQVLSDSQDAKREAEEATDDISLFAWIVTIEDAAAREDDRDLFAFDDALNKIRVQLEKSAKALRELADDLTAKASAVLDAKLEQLVEVYRPNLSGTASNAVALAMYISLEKLHSRIFAASNTYGEAAVTLEYWAYQLKELEFAANDLGWEMARLRRRKEIEAERKAVR